MKARIRTFTCAGLLASQFLTGCTSWKVVEVSPRALVDSAQVKSIRVTETGGETYVIEAPRLVGDTLTGGRLQAGYDSRMAADVKATVRKDHRVALATIDRVAVRKVNAVITGILVAVLGFVAAVAVGAAVMSANGLY